jgi:hypothetical protein
MILYPIRFPGRVRQIDVCRTKNKTSRESITGCRDRFLKTLLRLAVKSSAARCQSLPDRVLDTRRNRRNDSNSNTKRFA